MLPRLGTHISAAPIIWIPGISAKIPTSRPAATPRGTERRVKRHSSGRSTWRANGRTRRLLSSCSRVGACSRIQSARKVLDLKLVIVSYSPCAAEPVLASPPCPSGSSSFTHQPRLCALPVALLDRLPLVVGLLALRQRQLDLGPSAAVEVDRQRDHRHPLALDRAEQLFDLALVQQQLPRPARLVIEAVAVTELGDVRVDQPGLAIAHLGVALGDRALAEAQAFHFGAAERDPRLERFLDEVFEPCAPVLGDGLNLVEGRGFRAGHDEGARRESHGAVEPPFAAALVAHENDARAAPFRRAGRLADPADPGARRHCRALRAEREDGRRAEGCGQAFPPGRLIASARNDLRLSRAPVPTDGRRGVARCPEETRTSTPTSRSARPSTSPKATRNAALRRKPPRPAPGRPSTRRAEAATSPALGAARRTPTSRPRAAEGRTSRARSNSARPPPARAGKPAAGTATPAPKKRDCPYFSRSLGSVGSLRIRRMRSQRASGDEPAASTWARTISRPRP